MSKAIDLTGRKFGRLTVICENGRCWKQIVWECLCECGKKTFVAGRTLRTGHTRSCGCRKGAFVSEKIITHGQTAGRAAGKKIGLVYRVWSEMKERCYNPNCNRYHCYGARGIRVCERWRHSFENFAADMGPRPDGYSIDRINNNGNYEPSNCRWIPRADQAKKRQNTVYVMDADGKIPFSEWYRKHGIKQHVAYYLWRHKGQAGLDEALKKKNG